MALCALFLVSGGADAYPTYQTRRPGKAQPPPGKKNGTASSPGKAQPLPGKTRAPGPPTPLSFRYAESPTIDK